MAHDVFSETSALDDVQEEIEDRLAPELEKIRTVPGQIGVICTIGEQVVGLDLFDKPSTLERYLRGIVAGHALDAPCTTLERRSDPGDRALPRSNRRNGPRHWPGGGIG